MNKNKIDIESKKNKDKKEIKDYMEQFTLAWNNPKYNANLKKATYTACNLMVKKKVRILPDYKNYLTSVKKASENLLHIINDILDISKIEAGKMSVESVEFDLYKIVQNILDIFRYRVDPFQIQLNHSIGSEVPFKIKGDQHHLKQIMVEMLVVILLDLAQEILLENFYRVGDSY